MLNKDTKIVTQYWVLIAVAVFIFWLGVRVASYQSTIESTEKRVDRLEQIETRNVDRRNQTDQSIVRMETKLDQIYTEISRIAEYIENE